MTAPPLSKKPLQVFVAITAAGESSRMGSPKALLPWGNSTFLGVIAETAFEAGIEGSAVVVGAHFELLQPLAYRHELALLVNEDYKSGRFSSVQAAARWAISRAETRGAEAGLLLWPVDCPAVSVGTVRRLSEALGEDPSATWHPVHEGRAGHPVALGPSALSAIVLENRTANLREVLRAGPWGRRELEVDDVAVLDNVNTLDDLNRILARQDSRLSNHSGAAP